MTRTDTSDTVTLSISRELYNRALELVAEPPIRWLLIKFRHHGRMYTHWRDNDDTEAQYIRDRGIYRDPLVTT